MNDGNIITIWGSGGSGKTTAAIKLASALANRNKEVIIILTDISAPDMNVILPFEKDTKTMGYLWSSPTLNAESIYKACVLTKSDNICLLGYKHGENIFTHSDYTKDNITKVFMELKNMVDYVLVDCASEFAYNVLSTVALEMADKVIRLGEATPKSFSFFDSNLPLLLDSRYKSDQHIKVLSKTKSIQAREVATNKFGGIDVELPYTDELERQMLEGELFTKISSKSYKDYNIGINILIQLLDEKNIEEQDTELLVQNIRSETKKQKENIVEKISKQKTEKVKKALPRLKKVSFKLQRKRSDIVND